MRVFGLIGVVAALLAAAAATAAAQTDPVAAALKPAAAKPAFTPPADGKLTVDQIKMYIAVRRRVVAAAEKAGAETTPEGQIARVLATLTGDSAAAADAGADLGEYRWVSSRVAETEPAAAGPAGQAQLLDIIAAAINANPGVTAPPEVTPAARAAEQQATAARIDYNRKLLEPFKSELDALGKTPNP
jgi:hypothetical protein